MSRLRAAGSISDPKGLASAVLAEAVGYPGSSAAFAQLLSGMEKDGLIERQIRGKRTYQIGLAGGAITPAAGNRALGAEPMREPGSDAQVDGIDYDALARRLLVQVVQRLATNPPAAGLTSAPAQLPTSAEPLPEPREEDLARTVAMLERKLASTQSRQRKLSEENARLREQLAMAQQSLTEMQDAEAHGRRLDIAEKEMLEGLLSSLYAGRSQPESAEAG
jgi:hypothetical protein